MYKLGDPGQDGRVYGTRAVGNAEARPEARLAVKAAYGAAYGDVANEVNAMRILNDIPDVPAARYYGAAKVGDVYYITMERLDGELSMLFDAVRAAEGGGGGDMLQRFSKMFQDQCSGFTNR